ncbi:uncharacterized protein UV8b_06197 [Ustilaginoidea virens]|uniref:Peroxin 20 n=1 Tax=Ustilaginoidea virens TaxID=1159556 RepID=A0A8E5HUU6_USTVR|nr:uncharacterized protein UV8b_06197 [Ustilaginoidea virens]QUC21956.1 hypothetical protein UV8b_06197 [Ustilaginoidea virens]
MADASCSGPSPFKRLVDHHSRDVSHHQDHLVDPSAGRAHSSFRSPRQQTQDHDSFAAFVDAAPSVFPGAPHDAANRLAAHAAALQQQQHQRHQQQPVPARLSQQARASPAPDIGNWAADFARFSHQQARPGPAAQMHQQPAPMGLQPALGQAFGRPVLRATGPAGFMSPQAMPAAAESDFDRDMSQWVSSHGGGGDMSRVDAAMEQMARELELNGASLPAAAETTDAAAAEETARDTDALPSPPYTDLDTPEIGSLSLQERQGREQGPADRDAAPKAKSAVSQAAERLLESVQHEDGDKWQNSVFLSLMRDFRDGRKDIVDNEIRATAGDGAHEQHPQPTT